MQECGSRLGRAVLHSCILHSCISELCGSAWQLDRKPCAVRRVVATLDVAAVPGDDSTHDRQTQAAAPTLGRLVRKEQLFALCRGNPGPLSETTTRTMAFDGSSCDSTAMSPD